MIVLDTNVISELMRVERADARVLTWFRSLSERPLTTAVNRAELLSGIAALPHGPRRDDLRRDVDDVLDDLGPCLPFTDSCAQHYADFVALRRGEGRSLDAPDVFIAAICLDVGATLATRNTADFDGVGLELIDPWAS